MSTIYKLVQHTMHDKAIAIMEIGLMIPPDEGLIAEFGIATTGASVSALPSAGFAVLLKGEGRRAPLV